MMETLLGNTADNLLSITILAAWVASLYRDKSQLQSKLLECLDDLKRHNLEDK